MSRDPPLPSSSRQTYRRDGIGNTADVVQHAPLLFRRLASLGPGIVLVRSGRKIMRHHGGEITISAGGVLLIPDCSDFDVINEPGHGAPYQALALNFDGELVRRYAFGDGEPVQEIASVSTMPPGFEEACRRGAAAIAAGAELPDAVAAARVGEVLLWLSSLGYRFAPPANLDAMARLRRAIAADPARAWRAADAASLLCVSEPSLRRRLAAAGTSFTALLVDVRMSTALALLQSTDRPVTTIALDVGYDSPSRFSARFRARFDFAPSAIRGHQRHIERNGTKSDRPGAAAVAAE